MHIITLLLSVCLIAYITYDTLLNVSFLADPRYMTIQLWICFFFELDVLVELLLSEKKWRFLLSNLFFILICIPYLNIIKSLDLHLSDEVTYLLRFIPMIRAAYVLMIVTGLLTQNKIKSLFSSYVALLLISLYFCSLLFFVEEHYINPGVDTYWSSLWWSVMNMSTSGSSIHAMTPTGKVLAVILSAEGLILFPVFTVYITNAVPHMQGSTPDLSANAKHPLLTLPLYPFPLCPFQKICYLCTHQKTKNLQ